MAYNQFGQNAYGQTQAGAYGAPSYGAPAYGTQQPEGREISDGMTIDAQTLGDYDKGKPVLPPGMYEFTVVNLERTIYQPKPNKTTGITKPCPQVVLTLRIASQEGDVDLKHNLYMWSTTLGMIAQYFDCVNLHQKGEPLTVDFSPERHIGKRGFLDLALETSARGNQFNNIKRLLSPEEVAKQAQQAQQQAQQAAPSAWGNPAPAPASQQQGYSAPAPGGGQPWAGLNNW